MCSSLSWYVVAAWVVLASSVRLGAQPARYIAQGHAHNDYLHKQPLYDALDAGMASVEIDVYPQNGRLVVSHLPLLLGVKRDLVGLYVARAEKWLDRYGTWYADRPEHRLIWLVDLKRQPDLALEMLHQVAMSYPGLFTYYDSIGAHYGRIDVVLTGHRPSKSVMNGCYPRYFTLDGGWRDLYSPGLDTSLITRISARWGAHFKWRGRGTMKEQEQIRLQEFVQQARHAGVRLRFYAVPQRVEVWEEFQRQGVYWLNVDCINRFKQYWWK